MKHKYIYIIFFWMLVMPFLKGYAAPRPGNAKFIAGSEFKFYASDGDYVNYDFIIYYTCSAAAFNGTGDKLLVIWQSDVCCVKIVDTVLYNASKSNLKIAPFCQSGTDQTDCQAPGSQYPGFKTEVYSGRINLPCKACDWTVGQLYVCGLANQNFLLPTDVPPGMGTALSQLTAQPPLTTVPCVTMRQPFPITNLITQTNDATQGIAYNHAQYCNSLIKSYNNNTIPPTPVYKSNSSPLSVFSPFIYNCLGFQRTYDLGFVDPDGNKLLFSLASPFKDAPGSFGGAPTKIDFFGSCNASNPLCGNSICSLDPITGKLTIKATAGIGYFQTSIRVEEYDVTNQLVGVTYKDIVIVIENTGQCGDTNRNALKAEIQPDIYSPINCATLPLDPYNIQACAGTNISFDVIATSFSPYNNAAAGYDDITIGAKDMSPLLKSTGAYVSSRPYTTFNQAPLPSYNYGTFHWDIPANTPPGNYFVKFNIYTCVDIFNYSSEHVVNIRINSPTTLTGGFQNKFIDSNIIVLPSSKRMLTCDGAPQLQLNATNGQNSAAFIWKSLAGTNVTNTFGSNPNYYTADIMNPDINTMTGNTDTIIVFSDQYCMNSDTMILVKKPNINPILSFRDTIWDNIKPKCYGDTVPLIVTPAINGALYNWQTTNSTLLQPIISISNEVSGKLTGALNVYTVYVITTDTCVILLSKRIDLEGIKPHTSYTTDKQNVCPRDTINVYPFFTTAICGEDKYNIPDTVKFTSTFPGNQSNTNVAPKVFTSSPTIIHMKTQFIYLADELKKNDFKPGNIRSIGFFINGISTPNIYNNVTIRVKCENTRLDFSDNKFAETSDMMLLKTFLSANLTPGWNDFALGGGFSWDGFSNLIFEIQSTCSKPQAGATANSPSFADNATNYVSVIGRYGSNPTNFATNPVVTSFYRPNIRWDYYKFKNTNIHVQWNDSVQIPGKVTMGNDTMPNPKFINNKKSTYYVYTSSGRCIDTTTVVAKYNENYNIYMTLDSVMKCPSDTIKIPDTLGVIAREPFPYYCGVDKTNDLYKLYDINRVTPDTARIYDTVYFPYFGLKSVATGVGQVSPFGGNAATVGDPTTDKRMQIMFTANELKAMTGMKKGLITKLRFDVLTKFSNIIPLSSYSVKMRCIADTFDQFQNTNFYNSALFDEVFYSDNFGTTTDSNYIVLNKPFGWDSTMGIMIDICFNNTTASPYYGDLVKTHTTGTKNRVLYFATNTPATATSPDFGCAFNTGVRTTNRPNVGFVLTHATKPFPPIQGSITWAPNTYISNTKIASPYVYNEATTKYYVISDYIDTNIGQSVVACRVPNAFLSKVNRPDLKFQPSEVAACSNKPAVVTAYVPLLQSSKFDFYWTPSLGLDSFNKDNPKQIVSPPNPKYYYVRVSSKANPNCWNYDSVFVNIQQLSAMPDLGGASFICPGDSITISIPTNVGYKNPIWVYNGVKIDTGYKLRVGSNGNYQAIVDSGACTNISAIKEVTYRTPNIATLLNSNFKICQGDTVVIVYNIAGGVTKPLWNNGVATVVNKVTDAGQYFLINAKDQFGCDMIVRDTAKVNVISNPDITLKNDTICVAANQSIELISNPLDPSATYLWIPTGETTPSIKVVKPGKYTVIRSNLNCYKSADATISLDTFGRVNFGPNKAVCCDEIISLDANPLDKKYKTYNWSTGSTSQIVYTEPNVSGLYTVEAVKHNGCKDTGTIYIDSKCTQLNSKVIYREIQLGETNQIITTNLDVKATNVIYKWIPSQDYNKILNGNKANAIAKPMDTGDAEYVLMMTVIDSSYMPPKPYCVENSVVRFKVKPNGVGTVNAFSPNNDGNNDEWYPQIKGTVTMKEFKVYNRFGQLMHDDPLKPWDGKLNGVLQPIGVYVCIISYQLVEPFKDVETKYEQINLTLVR